MHDYVSILIDPTLIDLLPSPLPDAGLLATAEGGAVLPALRVPPEFFFTPFTVHACCIPMAATAAYLPACQGRRPAARPRPRQWQAGSSLHASQPGAAAGQVPTSQGRGDSAASQGRRQCLPRRWRWRPTARESSASKSTHN